MDGEGGGLDRGLRLNPAARHRRDDAKPRPFQGKHAIALFEYDPQQQAAETLRAASATVQAKEGVQETEAEGRWSDRCGDTIEAMKKAAGVARCGLSGKIDCQCNNNTPSPDNVEAAARLSSGGVLISVPRGGTSCMLQAEARRSLHARNCRCRPRYLQRRYARQCSDSCRCTPNGSYRMRSWRSVLDTA